MRRDRLELLKEILDNTKYKINTELGEIYGPKGNKIGYKNKRNTTVINFYYKKENGKSFKTYQYTKISVIAFKAGLYENLENPQDYIIIRKNTEEDYSLNNIEIKSKSEYFRENKDIFLPADKMPEKPRLKYKGDLREKIKRMYYVEKHRICEIRDITGIPYSSLSDIIKKS